MRVADGPAGDIAKERVVGVTVHISAKVKIKDLRGERRISANIRGQLAKHINTEKSLPLQSEICVGSQ
jgi:hypothetical protein